MKVPVLDQLVRPKNGLYDLTVPRISNVIQSDMRNSDEFTEVIVDKEQDMRLDLVMLSFYDNDPDILSNMDIICQINNIDNPLNIYVGMTLMFPQKDSFDSFRLIIDDTQPNQSAKIKQLLGVPNKTTRKDENRQKFIENNYSLPPVVMTTPREPVRLDGNNIVFGGL